MKSCAQCRQQNQDDANYCYQCGTELVAAVKEAGASSTIYATRSDTDLWRDFIGPTAERYLERFKKFGTEQSPKFALSWNWSPFLLIGGCSFLWFLYRKMYLYALIYAIGPVVSIYVTGDFTSGLVWNFVAGATANYVYYWHCREQIGAIKQQSWNDPEKLDAAMKESGGVQTYVIWVGVALYVLFSITVFKVIQEGSLDIDRVPGKSVLATAVKSV